jgi:hypothetical protein
MVSARNKVIINKASKRWGTRATENTSIQKLLTIVSSLFVKMGHGLEAPFRNQRHKQTASIQPCHELLLKVFTFRQILSVQEAFNTNFPLFVQECHSLKFVAKSFGELGVAFYTVGSGRKLWIGLISIDSCD